MTNNKKAQKFEFFVYEENFDKKFIKFRHILENCLKNIHSCPIMGWLYQKILHKNIDDLLLNEIEKNNSTWVLRKKDFMEFLISTSIYMQLDSLAREYLLFCFFKVEYYTEKIYKIKISSMKYLKCGDSNAYFPKNEMLFKYEGEKYKLGFSKHAIERFNKRCVAGYHLFITHHLYSLYMNSDIFLEEYYLNNKDKIEENVCAELYRPLFQQLVYDNEIIERFSGKYEPLNKFLYYFKVGYAPLHFDKKNKRVKMATILLPGMNGTPEFYDYKEFVNSSIKEEKDIFSVPLAHDAVLSLIATYLQQKGHKQFLKFNNTSLKLSHGANKIQKNIDMFNKYYIESMI